MTVAESDGVAAVDRAMAIVKVIAAHTEPITLADLARATGFYKSTLLRLIVSLEKASLVARRPDGRYAIGPFAHQLGRAYDTAYGLSDVVQPLLQDLVDQGSESASFHVYHDTESRLCLLRVDSHHSTLDRIRPGDLLPLDRGAAGKLISTFAHAETVPRRADLVAVSMGERDPSCAAVAAAVFDANDTFCGAISLSGPKERFTPAAVKKMKQTVEVAAVAATRALGGRWPK